ncbi:MAG TPA: hypothetical protein VJ486_07675 [Geothrix sp.]|nr:hypothetical protein [Geothrix sp.]
MPVSPPGPSSDSLEARLAALEARVARLEQAGISLKPMHGKLFLAESEPPVPLAEAPAAISVLGGIGRVFLILGGAFFLRALTEGGTLPRPLGVALGFLYALVWAYRAWRTPGRGNSGFYTLSSILIAYPLLAESTIKFSVIPTAGSAVLLLILVTIHLRVSWRRDIEPLAWLTALATLGTGLILLFVTHAIELFAATFLILGAGVLWMTYGRRWHGLRWPTALVADGVVLILTVLAAWPGGPPEVHRDLNATRAIVLAMALPMLYITSFGWRMLQRHRVINVFEGIQTALTLMIGFGGAVRIALASGKGTGALGFAVLAGGVASYAAAFPFVADQEEVRANFNFFTSLGLVFLLLGSPVLLPIEVYSLLAAALGLAAMGLGLRFRRTVLVLQGGVCLLVAALASGLLAASLQAFLASAQDMHALPGAAWIVAATLIAACLLVETKRPPEGFPTRLRLTAFLVGTLGVLCTGGLVLISALRLGGTVIAHPPILAFLRTAVLSAAAVALAVHSRHCPKGELRWLAYPVLGLAGLKFILEDLPLGHPMALFLAFMCLGAAFILTPRLLKTHASAEPSPPAEV